LHACLSRVVVILDAGAVAAGVATESSDQSS
jgi:hypothetical protein